MRKLFAGIDPGLHGGIVIVDSKEDKVVFSTPMPLTDAAEPGRKDVDSVLLHMYLSTFRSEIHLLALEKVHARPMQGAVSTFTFGRVYGKTIAVLEILGICFKYVPPSVWTKKILPEGIDEKKGSILWFEKRWGKEPLYPGKHKNPHDGVADAGCLAEFANLDYHS